jgi:UDP-glucose 4-epimerase
MIDNHILDDKILLITGGTGSFGNAVIKRFLQTKIKEIRIFSRDEKKQNDMRLHYNNGKLRFYIGDVRDKNSIRAAMQDVDYVFHAAALKQVPSCEFFPVEAIKTNCLGTNNVLETAIESGVKNVICLSTDKAAYPINAMGMTKALMEKVAIAKSRNSKNTIICVTRYGNVMGSRGSVIPIFYEQLAHNLPLTVTSPSMTRYMMTLDQAVELVLFAFTHGKSGDLFVQKAPAATIDTLAKAICQYKGKPVNIEYLGVRHGEKDHEVLVTREEMTRASDMGNFYRVSMDGRDLNYAKYKEEGDKKIELAGEYSSNNTEQLDEAGVIKLLDLMGDIE